MGFRLLKTLNGEKVLQQYIHSKQAYEDVPLVSESAKERIMADIQKAQILDPRCYFTILLSRRFNDMLKMEMDGLSAFKSNLIVTFLGHKVYVVDSVKEYSILKEVI